MIIDLNKLFKDVYEKLKPEFRHIPVITKDETKTGVFGECHYLTKPPTIYVYMGNFKEAYEESIKDNFKRVLTHELIHAIQDISTPVKEKDAYGKQNKLNFFN